MKVPATFKFLGEIKDCRRWKHGIIWPVVEITFTTVISFHFIFLKKSVSIQPTFHCCILVVSVIFFTSGRLTENVIFSELFFFLPHWCRFCWEVTLVFVLLSDLVLWLIYTLFRCFGNSTAHTPWLHCLSPHVYPSHSCSSVWPSSYPSGVQLLALKPPLLQAQGLFPVLLNHQQ